MEQSARNRTPDKLPAETRRRLTDLCDTHLESLITALHPEWVVGVGAYAEQCIQRVAQKDVNVTRILHPSPASPAANKGWAAAARKQLFETGIWKSNEAEEPSCA